MNKSIERAAVAGLVFIIIGFTLVIMNLIGGLDQLEDIQLLFYVLVYIFSLILAIVFIWGFNSIANITGNLLLQITSNIFILFTVIFQIFFFIPLMPLFPLLIFDAGLSLPIVLFVAALGILFGIGLIRLKNKFDMMAISTGILQIISSLIFLIINLPKGFINFFPVNSLVEILTIAQFITIDLPENVINTDFITLSFPIIPIFLIILAHIFQITLLFKVAKEL